MLPYSGSSPAESVVRTSMAEYRWVSTSRLFRHRPFHTCAIGLGVYQRRGSWLRGSATTYRNQFAIVKFNHSTRQNPPPCFPRWQGCIKSVRSVAGISGRHTPCLGLHAKEGGRQGSHRRYRSLYPRVRWLPCKSCPPTGDRATGKLRNGCWPACMRINTHVIAVIYSVRCAA